MTACADPHLGQQLEAYLDRQLAEEGIQAYEAHYFSCVACLEEIRFRQVLVDALKATSKDREVSPERSPAPRPGPIARWLAPGARRLALMTAGAVLVAGIGLWMSGRDREATPGVGPKTILSLDGVYRGDNASEATVEAGRAPIELSLFVPVLSKPGVRYSVQVEDDDGDLIHSEADVPPDGVARLPVLLPTGIKRPGLYHVVIEEHRPDGAESLTLHYDFRVVPASARRRAPRP